MEKITITKHQSQWEEQFNQAKNKLESLGIKEICSIEHIGSTSIPGLAAKNRIDIQVALLNLNDSTFEKINEVLLHQGFYSVRKSEDHVLAGSDFPSNQWKKFFLRGVHSSWDFQANIHFRKLGSYNWRYALLFRDFLKAHPKYALAYENLKKNLSYYLPEDRIAYADIKDPVCDLILIRAEEWATQSGWAPN